ncbi:hypothetical protein HDU67_006654 [Dinochytrium kinnereticum]|nr:hypothetical protein HDU67_006654 [Dinochytrium kinnereticum]
MPLCRPIPAAFLNKTSLKFLVLILFALIVAWNPTPVKAAHHEQFKECHQSGFCVRHRAFSRLQDKGRLDQPSYRIESVSKTKLELENRRDQALSNGRLRANVEDPFRPNVTFLLEVEFLSDGPIRIRIVEKDPIAPRFELFGDLALEKEPELTRETVTIHEGRDDIVMQCKNTSVRISKNPLVIRVYRDGDEVAVFNGKGYLNYEHLRTRDDDPPSRNEVNVRWNVHFDDEEDEVKLLKSYLEFGKWEEEFGGKTDKKPYGPSSIGIDVTFPSAKNLYGLPEHASNFSLKETRLTNGDFPSDPYRLYNLDVFEYEVDSPMSLYGSVPFVMGHGGRRATSGKNFDVNGQGHSVGLLWLNAAEMWVDLERSGNDPESLTSSDNSGMQLHWMTESGILDLFVFIGESPSEVTSLLTKTTGRPQLPPLFSVGYHQCRWNYNDETDVLAVDKGFDDHNIPYDVIWLDIEHTVEKKYFTWDPVKFPDPVSLQESLASKGRKMVTIIDPHIKRDNDYDVYRKFSEQDLFVKDSKGRAFEGWCWPGSSSWIDFLHPEARRLWASLFSFQTYLGSSRNLYTWNDMNEPSVFTGPEVTMPKDSKHVYGWEHRDVHNIYGALQRYGAVWTGDNAAKWSYLQASIPMLLSLGVAGISFAGADVGGFFGNPEPELAVRWYQAAAFQPFFRGHAHIDTARREPWVFGEPFTSLIREAIRRRYQLLPYIYTLFWEAHTGGSLVMRPLFFEFPDDEMTFGKDDAFMLGSSLLIHPVTKKNQTSIDVYLPTSDIWYDYSTYKRVPAGLQTFSCDLAFVPTFLRAGSIVVRRDTVRTSSAKSLMDPFTVIISVNGQEEAKGSLYLDDGESYDQDSRGYLSTSITYVNGTLHIAEVRGRDLENTLFALGIEKIVVVGSGLKGPIQMPDYDVEVEGGFVEFRFRSARLLPISREGSVHLME